MKALALVAMLAGTAHAQWYDIQDRVQGGSFGHYELTGLTAISDDARATMTAPQDVVLAGLRLGGYLGQSASVHYFIALDLFAGSTIGKAGFAYDVALYPIGTALRFGKTNVLAVGGGIGASGAVNTLDDAMMLPIQVTLEAGRSWRLLARARLGYIVGSDARQSAAPNVPFADEFDAMLGIRRGKHYDKHGFPSGNGYFLAVNYREQNGTRYAGATIGYSLDASMPRRFARRSRRRW